ncbi:MAG: hypothetical protein WCE75_02330 [Terracidiphilus sp.]
MGALKIPKSDSEAEVADWLYENRERLAGAFLEAAKEGRVGQGTHIDLARKNCETTHLSS